MKSRINIEAGWRVSQLWHSLCAAGEMLDFFTQIFQAGERKKPKKKKIQQMEKQHKKDKIEKLGKLENWKIRKEKEEKKIEEQDGLTSVTSENE